MAVHCPSGPELARFVDGCMSPDEVAALSPHLPRCARCRAAVDEMTALTEQLAGPLAGAPEVDLVARVLERAALPPPRPRVARLALGAAIGFAAAAALAVVVGVSPNRQSATASSGAVNSREIAGAGPRRGVDDAPFPGPAGGADEDLAFQARGGARSDASRWIALRPFRVDSSGRAAPLPRTGGRLDARDALLLAYDNGGPRPYAHLAAFAVETSTRGDRASAVHWLYPDGPGVGSSRVDLQACKLEYSIVSPK